MEILHDKRAKKFYTTIDGREYSLEYNEISSSLWEFHCPYIPNIVTNLKHRDIQEDLIEFALAHMAQHQIQLFESGTCYHVKDFLDRKSDLQFLVKYVV